jgi:hypothetical protein
VDTTVIAAKPDTDARSIEIVRLLQRCRLDLSSEKRVQEQIEQVLTDAGIVFEREKRLSVSDIPDFLIDGGILVECKMRGARKMDIYRQMRRYAAYPEVRALLLVSNLVMGLPSEIDGKPVYSASLSRGWV